MFIERSINNDNKCLNIDYSTLGILINDVHITYLLTYIYI